MMGERRIIGATATQRTCATCAGAGIVEGYQLIGEYCPAEVDTGHEAFSCIIKGFHDGRPHEDHASAGCDACGGFDHHTDWCPKLGTREQVERRICTILFDDDGWYWAADEGMFSWDSSPTSRVPG